jgi:Ca2+/Na+ antiporter
MSPVKSSRKCNQETRIVMLLYAVCVLILLHKYYHEQNESQEQYNYCRHGTHDQCLIERSSWTHLTDWLASFRHNLVYGHHNDNRVSELQTNEYFAAKKRVHISPPDDDRNMEGGRGSCTVLYCALFLMRVRWTFAYMCVAECKSQNRTHYDTYL